MINRHTTPVANPDQTSRAGEFAGIVINRHIPSVYVPVGTIAGEFAGIVINRHFIADLTHSYPGERRRIRRHRDQPTPDEGPKLGETVWAGEFAGIVINRHKPCLALPCHAAPAGEFAGIVINRHILARCAASLAAAPANSPAS